MMAGAHGNPEDLKKFAKQLRDTKAAVSGLGRDLSRTLASIDWNDSVKTKIDSDVTAVIKGLEKFGAKLDEHAKEVDRKAGKLKEYLGR